MPGVTITHDCVVGDFTTFAAGVSLGGACVVGEGAYLGMNSSVRQGVTVGSASTVGMGAVCWRMCRPGRRGSGYPPAADRQPWLSSRFGYSALQPAHAHP